MNILFYSYILGPIILCLLYALCFFLVVGIKAVIYVFSSQNKPQPVILEPKPEPKKVQERKRKPVKSIEIDPDYIDRIYVKKSS